MKKHLVIRFALLFVTVFLLLATISCSNDTKAAPTKSQVTVDPNIFTVDRPELFRLVPVETKDLPSLVISNGSVMPDATRTIHVTSQGSGRVSDLRVKLGDYAKKGDVLVTIHSADLASAFSDYQKAVTDERFAKKALDRAQLLYSHGAFAQKDLEAAEDAEDKARADVQTTEQRVRLLGGDPNHPGSIIELRAPVSGTIVEQNVAGFEGVKTLDNSPNLFTIADLSQVWIVCDVYENDLGDVKVGDTAEIKLNAYPDMILRGKVSDISRVLDPTTRSAKVRIVLPNTDGTLRPGMFAVATFQSRKLQSRVVVPTTAIMRLHDRDWIFRKEGENKFRKIEVKALGPVLESMTEIDGGVKPGEQIVLNALEFSSSAAEQGQ
jgi:membrane fusion protein, heavy metal efflux system